MDSLCALAEKQFCDVITQLVNEIDLTFDYVTDKSKEALNAYVHRIKSDNEFLKAEMETFHTVMAPYMNDMQEIVLARKLKNSFFAFMEQITLFNGILNCGVFASENKNTKRTLVEYFNTMFISCAVIKCPEDTEGFLKTILQNEVVLGKEEQQPKKQHSRRSAQPQLGGVFDSLLSNPQLRAMVEDISKDIELEDMDPMTMLSSLMSGKPDAKLTRIVDSVKDKLDTKISSGELDTDALEVQAKDMMSMLSKNGVMNNMMKAFPKQ